MWLFAMPLVKTSLKIVHQACFMHWLSTPFKRYASCLTMFQQSTGSMYISFDKNSGIAKTNNIQTCRNTNHRLVTPKDFNTSITN